MTVIGHFGTAFIWRKMDMMWWLEISEVWEPSTEKVQAKCGAWTLCLTSETFPPNKSEAHWQLLHIKACGYTPVCWAEDIQTWAPNPWKIQATLHHIWFNCKSLTSTHLCSLCFPTGQKHCIGFYYVTVKGEDRLFFYIIFSRVAEGTWVPKACSGENLVNLF